LEPNIRFVDNASARLKALRIRWVQYSSWPIANTNR
jgi:hypothetical protein